MTPHGEDHYVLRQPDLVLRMTGQECRRVRHSSTPTEWSRPGAGRTAAAAVILVDATGRSVSSHLAFAFSHDILDHHFAERMLVIAVREVREWRIEREREVDDAARNAPVPQTLPEMLALADAALRGGPWSSWLSVFRAVNGPPQIPAFDSSHPHALG